MALFGGTDGLDDHRTPARPDRAAAGSRRHADLRIRLRPGRQRPRRRGRGKAGRSAGFSTICGHRPQRRPREVMCLTACSARSSTGDIPASIVYQDEHLVAFKDINPQAPMHVLIVPRRHIATLNELGPEDDGLVGEMVRRAAAIAREHGHRRPRLPHRLQLQRGRGPDGLPHPSARPRRAGIDLAAGLSQSRAPSSNPASRNRRNPDSRVPIANRDLEFLGYWIWSAESPALGVAMI